MKKQFRDIIRESLQEQALSASFDSKISEINILIDAHENALQKAVKDLNSANDSIEHKEALSRKISELEKLIPLYHRKKQLMAKSLESDRKETIDGIDYGSVINGAAE